METNRAKIIAIFGILALSLFVGLLIRIIFREQQPKSNTISASQNLGKTGTLKNPIPLLKIPALPTIYPADTAAPFFENINKITQKIENSIAPSNIQNQNISTETSAGIILSLTESQFHFLYPESFIAGLLDAQNLFTEYDPGYRPISKIETDAQVRFIEERIVAMLVLADVITKDRAEQLVTTIRFTLPRLQLIDLQNYYSYGSYKAPKKMFLANLMDELANALARRAQSACGSCHSLPECFQVGASAPELPGKELFYSSCYCTGCFTGLGCLSANSGQAAIYDQATGICGVGL